MEEEEVYQFFDQTTNEENPLGAMKENYEQFISILRKQPRYLAAIVNHLSFGEMEPLVQVQYRKVAGAKYGSIDLCDLPNEESKQHPTYSIVLQILRVINHTTDYYFFTVLGFVFGTRGVLDAITY